MANLLDVIRNHEKVRLCIIDLIDINKKFTKKYNNESYFTYKINYFNNYKKNKFKYKNLHPFLESIINFAYNESCDEIINRYDKLNEAEKKIFDYYYNHKNLNFYKHEVIFWNYLTYYRDHIHVKEELIENLDEVLDFIKQIYGGKPKVVADSLEIIYSGIDTYKYYKKEIKEKTKKIKQATKNFDNKEIINNNSKILDI